MEKKETKSNSARLIKTVEIIWIIVTVAVTLGMFIPDNKDTLTFNSETEVVESAGYAYATSAIKSILRDDEIVSIDDISWIVFDHGDDSDFFAAVKVVYNDGNENGKCRFFKTSMTGKNKVNAEIDESKFENLQKYMIFSLFYEGGWDNPARTFKYDDFAISVIFNNLKEKA